MKKLVMGFVLGCATMAAIAFSAVAIGQQDSGSEVGRYSVAATNRSGNTYSDIYVVVIDTKTGEIVKTDVYDKKEFDKK